MNPEVLEDIDKSSLILQEKTVLIYIHRNSNENKNIGKTKPKYIDLSKKRITLDNFIYFNKCIT